MSYSPQQQQPQQQVLWLASEHVLWPWLPYVLLSKLSHAGPVAALGHAYSCVRCVAGAAMLCMLSWHSVSGGKPLATGRLTHYRSACCQSKLRMLLVMFYAAMYSRQATLCSDHPVASPFLSAYRMPTSRRLCQGRTSHCAVNVLSNTFMVQWLVCAWQSLTPLSLANFGAAPQATHVGTVLVRLVTCWTVSAMCLLLQVVGTAQPVKGQATRRPSQLPGWLDGNISRCSSLGGKSSTAQVNT